MGATARAASPGQRPARLTRPERKESKSAVADSKQVLVPDDKHAIRARNGLLPVPRPAVSNPEDIVAALSARDLSGWADLTRGVPAGARAALDEAAERMLPQVQAVTLPSAGTITNPPALDAWLASVRATLAQALTKGPVRPRF